MLSDKHGDTTNGLKPPLVDAINVGTVQLPPDLMTDTVAGQTSDFERCLRIASDRVEAWKTSARVLERVKGHPTKIRRAHRATTT